MRAMKPKQSGATAAIAKKHEVLSQNSYRGRLTRKRPGLLAKFGYGSEPAPEHELLVTLPQGFNSRPPVGDGYRKPVSAEPITSRRTGTYSREHFIFFCTQHRKLSLHKSRSWSRKLKLTSWFSRSDIE